MVHVRQLGTRDLTFLSLKEMKEAVNACNSKYSEDSDIDIAIVGKGWQPLKILNAESADKKVNLSSMVNIPSLNENQEDTNRRFWECYHKIIHRHRSPTTAAHYAPATGSVLCVTHWEGVSQLIYSVLQEGENGGGGQGGGKTAIPNRSSYGIVSECGYIALDLNTCEFIDCNGVSFS
jgi:hypothetical protein